jgi:N-acetylglutamate synthase-like GNAT family acetyltransferase
MKTEKFTPKYSREVGELISSIQRNEFNIPITLEQQPDLSDISTYYQKGCGNFWVALENEKVIGTIALLDIDNNQVALRKMFVHQDFRGSEFGTAKLLLNQALEWAKESGVKQVLLGTTAKYLAAHRFYEKHGFLEITEQQLPKNFPVMIVDTKFYMKEVNSA